MRSPFRWLLALAAGLIGLVGLFLGGLGVLIRVNTREAFEDYTTRAKPALEVFLADQAALKGDPFFTDVRKQGECSLLLNNLPPLPSAKAELDKTWLALPTPIDLAGVDLAWMKSLHECDHWDLVADFPDVWRWGRLRLLAGLQAGKLEEAGRDVRQLAWLVYSTEKRYSASRAAGLLALVEEAQTASRRVGGPVGSWPAPELDRFRRVGGGYDVFGTPLLDTATLRAAHQVASAPVALCESLNLLAETAGRLAPFLESDAARFLPEVEGLLKQAPARCRLVKGKARWNMRQHLRGAAKNELLRELPPNGIARFTVRVLPTSALREIATAVYTQGNPNILAPRPGPFVSSSNFYWGR